MLMEVKLRQISNFSFFKQNHIIEYSIEHIQDQSLKIRKISSGFSLQNWIGKLASLLLLKEGKAWGKIAFVEDRIGVGKKERKGWVALAVVDQRNHISHAFVVVSFDSIPCQLCLPLQAQSLDTNRDRLTTCTLDM